MCTVLTLTHNGTLWVVGNRDEDRRRPAATAPRVREGADGRGAIFPLDPRGQGTWVSANADGVVVTLLNGYQPRDAQPTAAGGAPRPSRGGIVRRLAWSASVEQAQAEVEGWDLTPYATFVLLVFGAARDGAPARGWRLSWDGHEAERARLELPWIEASSSVDRAHVLATREATLRASLAEAPIDAASLRARFASHAPTRGPASVCMHRDDAETRNFWCAKITPHETALGFVPHAPCVDTPTAWTRLPRATTAGPA